LKKKYLEDEEIVKRDETAGKGKVRQSAGKERFKTTTA